LTNQAGTKSRP